MEDGNIIRKYQNVPVTTNQEIITAYLPQEPSDPRNLVDSLTHKVIRLYNVGPVYDSVQLVQITPIPMVYGTYNELVTGVKSQFTTFGGFIWSFFYIGSCHQHSQVLSVVQNELGLALGAPLAGLQPGESHSRRSQSCEVEYDEKCFKTCGKFLAYICILIVLHVL